MNKIDNYGLQIGIAVKKIRERKNITQSELQNSASLSSGYISRLEKGDYESPSIVHIMKISKALGMNLRDFLEYADLIPLESNYSSLLRNKGATEDQIRDITNYETYVLAKNLKEQ
jgi:transcriptional regulator with XRE-family HTH domain